MGIRIDPEFKNFLGPLDDDTHLALENTIRADGCRDALVVWPQPDGDAILLDGHNRYEICERLGIDFRVTNCPESVADRQDAIAWIVENQRARRNLTSAEIVYLRGKIYQAEKKDDLANLCQNRNATPPGGKSYHPERNQKTAERIANEFGVAEKTIRNNAKFAERVDAIAAIHGPAAKGEILAGRKKVSDYADKPEPATEPEPPPEPPEADPEPSDQSGSPVSRPMSDSECVDWMARTQKPNGPSGAVAKPIPMPECAGENRPFAVYAGGKVV